MSFNTKKCSITLHVSCKIAVFVSFQVLTMAKTDTKVKNQVLTNILHCSVDHKNGLASTGTSIKWNHARNFEPKTQVFTSKAKLQNFGT